MDMELNKKIQKGISETYTRFSLVILNTKLSLFGAQSYKYMAISGDRNHCTNSIAIVPQEVFKFYFVIPEAKKKTVKRKKCVYC